MITTRDFLVRGLLAGLVAGVVAFGVASALGEPSVDQAIALEEAVASAAEHSTHSGQEPTPGHTRGDEAGATEVPRSLQSTVGLLTATTVMGAVLGGLAGVVTGFGIGRLGRLSPRATALSVAASGLVTLSLVPFLVYPPNPPAVGSGDTIGRRTGLYFALVALSVVCAGIAAVAGTRLRDRIGGWYATLVAIGGYLTAMVGAIALMPTYDEVGADFPAQVLYDFRLGSLMTQVALWAALGVALAELVQRLLSPAPPAPVQGRRDAVHQL